MLLRHDHGSAFMSDYFQNHLKVFGMAPSFAFVREPETNGVAERFIRTLKEQIIFGRIYQDIEEVRAAVRAYRGGWLRLDSVSLLISGRSAGRRCGVPVSGWALVRRPSSRLRIPAPELSKLASESAVERKRTPTIYHSAGLSAPHGHGQRR